MKNIILIAALLLASFQSHAVFFVQIQNTSNCDVYYKLYVKDKNTCNDIATYGIVALSPGSTLLVDVEDPAFWGVGSLPPTPDLCFGAEVGMDCTLAYFPSVPIGEPCCFGTMSDIIYPYCCPAPIKIDWVPTGNPPGGTAPVYILDIHP